MNIELLNGDCLSLMSSIPDGSVDAIICDLPYGTTACKWDTVIPFDPLWAHYKRVIKPNGAIVLFGSQPFTSALVMSNPTWFKCCWVWEKHQGTNPICSKYQPMKCHEDVLIFARGTTTYNPIMTPGTPYGGFEGIKPIGELYGKGTRSKHRDNSAGNRFPRSVQYFRGDRGLHPTQKPVALLEYLIRTYTNEGETVLDNTMGSGTTGVACMNTGRNFIGIEKDVGYFEIARNRIEVHNTEIRPRGTRGLVTTEIEMSEYKSMFEQAVRTLAAIDDALGIGGDGCCDPEQTLDAIAELKAAASRGVELARTVMSDNVGKA